MTIKKEKKEKDPLYDDNDAIQTGAKINRRKTKNIFPILSIGYEEYVFSNVYMAILSIAYIDRYI